MRLYDRPLAAAAADCLPSLEMPPKAKLNAHLTPDELKQRYRHARDTAEARRWQLIHLVAQSWTIKQAAQAVDLNYDYAKEIIRRYNQEGPAAVQNRTHRRPVSPRSLLTAEQQRELQQALQASAPDGGKWSGPKVAQWIAERTGRSHVWPQRGWDYLRRFQPPPTAAPTSNGHSHGNGHHPDRDPAPRNGYTPINRDRPYDMTHR